MKAACGRVAVWLTKSQIKKLILQKSGRRWVSQTFRRCCLTHSASEGEQFGTRARLQYPTEKDHGDGYMKKSEARWPGSWRKIIYSVGRSWREMFARWRGAGCGGEGLWCVSTLNDSLSIFQWARNNRRPFLTYPSEIHTKNKSCGCGLWRCWGLSKRLLWWLSSVAKTSLGELRQY